MKIKSETKREPAGPMEASTQGRVRSPFCFQALDQAARERAERQKGVQEGGEAEDGCTSSSEEGTVSSL